MNTDEIKNKHLSFILEHVKLYTDDNEKIPLELLLHLIGELKVSNLLIPAVQKNDGFIFENIKTDDDKSFLPLFTNLEEYKKHRSDDNEFIALDNDFDIYMNIVKQSSLDGIIINPEGYDMVFDSEFLSKIPESLNISPDDEKAYSKEQLKDVFKSIKNESFVKFMSEASRNDLEQLMVEMGNARLLNAVIGDENTENFVKDGILKAEDIGGFDLWIINDEPIHLAMLFTDIDEMKATLDDFDVPYYGQITILTNLFEFILRNDMDGLVINPNSQDYYILREEIISQARGIELIPEDAKFSASLDYAFKL